MPSFDNSTPNTGAFVDSENNVLDIQEVLQSGQVIVTLTEDPDPIEPVGEATTPKYQNISPWSGKLLNPDNEIYDLINLLTSGNIKVQITSDRGIAPGDATYITSTDETSDLPNSVPLSGLSSGFLSNTTGTGVLNARVFQETANQILISNANGVDGAPVFSLSDDLILPGQMSMGGDLKLLTHKITSSSGTPIQLIPDNDNDGIDLASTVVRIEQDIRHAGEEDNKMSFTTGAQTNYIGGNSIYDITEDGFRLGMGYRVQTISNDSAAFLDTQLMTAFAIQTAIGNAIISGNNFRGAWDASGGLFPTTGGTGPAGAVAAGNNWRISVAGTLGGEPVDAGDQIIAAVAIPGQTASNWIIVNPRVFSVFGRTGTVLPQGGDYAFNQVTGLPSTAATGKFMRGNGSAWLETTSVFADTYAANSLLLAASANNVSGLATQNSSFLTTDASGNVGWSVFPATQYNVLSGGASGSINNIPPSTAGYVLTSNGASMQPTFQAIPNTNYTINMQTFTASGTYTPTAGMVYCVIECQAPGGGGGGKGSAFVTGIAGGGGAGAYARKTVTAATIGASQSVTIGAVGNGGASTGTNGVAGTAGGTTSVGSIVSCTGGGGGANVASAGAGGAGGVATGGDYNIAGKNGAAGLLNSEAGIGQGGDAVLGWGANASGSSGTAAGNYGGGGAPASSPSTAGGPGGPGVVIITEYCL